MRPSFLPLTFLASLLMAAPPAKPIPDQSLGLSKASVFTVPSPPAYQAEASGPGEKPAPKRLGPEIPPVIPHGVVDYLPITRDSNLCIDCHATPGPKKKGEATPIPASHYVDLRRAPEKAGTTVAGARYVCTACHAARTNAQPLVVNRYMP